MTLRALATAALLAFSLGACQQQEAAEPDPAEFYKGKTITIVVGVSVGGIYDNVARIVARYLPKHIPGNPAIIVQNMPGAASLTAANFVYGVAPKDGLTLALLVDGALLAPLWKIPGANYDSREVGWLGALHTRDTSVVMIRSDSPATTYEQAKVKEIVLGSTGANSVTSSFPKMLNELLDTKFKIVVGYPGYQEILLAIERGEVHGRAATNWESVQHERPDWIAKRFVMPLLQLVEKPIAGMDAVPLALDLAKNDEDRELMRAVFNSQRFSYIFSAPQGMPEKRLAALRKAFEEMSADAEFRKAMLDYTGENIRPTNSNTILEFVRTSYAMPEPMRARAATYVAN